MSVQKKIAAVVAVVSVAFGIAASTVESHAQQLGARSCGVLYSAIRGDTLFKIAEKTYRDGWKYETVLAANKDVLSSPQKLEVGDLLFLPCLDGTGPSTRGEALAATREANYRPTSYAAADLDRKGPALTRTPLIPDAKTLDQDILARSAKFLIRADHERFARADLPEGGVLPELITRAMLRAQSDLPFQMIFDASHSEEPSNIALSFPHVKPDCSRSGTLSSASRDLCQNHIFSDAILEIEYAFYARPGTQVATAHQVNQLAGLRICWPKGRAVEDLERAGEAWPGVIMMPAASIAKCLEQVAEGEADVASAPRREAEAILATFELAPEIVEVGSLSSRTTLHAVTARESDPGRASIDAINRGLRLMRATGEFSEVTRMHMIVPLTPKLALPNGRIALLAGAQR